MAIEVRRAVTINRPRAEVYGFWRQLENLPRFMKHLESVTETGDNRSHWVAKAPPGGHAEWDAEIVQEVPNDYLAWRSLPESELPNRGEVRFVDAPAGRGTEIHTDFSYDPPGGPVGELFARIFGEDPDTQAWEDLRRFKQILETGEIPTTEGQPSGREKTEEPEKTKTKGWGLEHPDDLLVSPGPTSTRTKGNGR
jgi:uncharacterized membrane protein